MTVFDMKPSEITEQAIHPATRMGHVHYTVADLVRQISFYRDVLGFQVHWREGDSAGLGAGQEDLLRLTQREDARRYRGTTGLYHTAFLVPTRWDLAHLLRRIAETRTRIQGMSDHGTHHAIYLPDVEGNGIELAWDRPKDQWPKTFTEMLSANGGLHPDDVFSALTDRDDEWQGLDAATAVGHVHLHVADLPSTMHFYRDVLGFGLPMDFENAPRQFTDSAIFFAAGDYHHHIGTNVWQGIGAPQPPEDATGLRTFSVIVPDEAELARVRARIAENGLTGEETESGFLVYDPAHNGVLLTTA
ncbi:VOC family protein [Phototrophicus methaneseepsis]|uniref:VOC family protein n=1 Tax=Phototrophicus methaneseepsis TaxID=2710758 RepID=A0A7S8E981_9CHLR|nr:VOC family protein [Phototrophicus methaneseepsis]QPC82667.1 VOC family protein [Phototrophicus methaneseepsis]